MKLTPNGPDVQESHLKQSWREARFSFFEHGMYNNLSFVERGVLIKCVSGKRPFLIQGDPRKLAFHTRKIAQCKNCIVIILDPDIALSLH